MGWWVPRLCWALGFAGVASAIDAAGAGAGVVLPTPGVEAWCAAVREAVYALCERSSTCGRPSTGQFC